MKFYDTAYTETANAIYFYYIKLKSKQNCHSLIMDAFPELRCAFEVITLVKQTERDVSKIRCN